MAASTEQLVDNSDANIIEDQVDSEEDLICEPLRTIEELRDWRSSRHPRWARRVIRLEPRTKTCIAGRLVTTAVDSKADGPLMRCEGNTVPRTLVCHDYKGGYGDDRYVDGTTLYNEYRFFHWAGVDTFVYFSHHFVTIPPLAWINAGHRHGVKVLGTLITEWKEGMAIWETILASVATADQYAGLLADVCRYFRFDGYLLNVENEVAREHIGMLEYFLRSLRSRLPRGAQLIWYDSVTLEGLLRWQNRLNDLNKHFFDECDGIFLNYGWREADLEASVSAAGLRRLDVYVGVDVFGRGVFGGGGFNCDKALSLIRRHGLSVAIFAPGWTHETQPAHHFTELEYSFWQKLWPFLYVRGPTALPFHTSFCQGFGLGTYNQGVVSGGPWYNVGLQEVQATCAADISEACVSLKVERHVRLTDEVSAGRVQYTDVDGFTGGGCLVLRRQRSLAYGDTRESNEHRLFVCGFESSGPLLVSYASKATDGDAGMDLVLIMEDSSDGRFEQVVLTDDVNHNTASDVVAALRVEEVVALLRELHLQVDPYANNGWTQSFYKLDQPGKTIVEIRARIRGSSVMLGNLRIIPL